MEHSTLYIRHDHALVNMQLNCDGNPPGHNKEDDADRWEAALMFSVTQPQLGRKTPTAFLAFVAARGGLFLQCRSDAANLYLARLTNTTYHCETKSTKTSENWSLGKVGGTCKSWKEKRQNVFCFDMRQVHAGLSYRKPTLV